MTGKEDSCHQNLGATAPTADLFDSKVPIANRFLENNLHSWQADLLTKFQGFSPGDLVVLSYGRQTGKSYYYEYTKEYSMLRGKNFVVQENATVDDEPWYTINCTSEVGNWIRNTSDKSKWSDLGAHRWIQLFDIHESILLQLNLKFS